MSKKIKPVSDESEQVDISNQKPATAETVAEKFSQMQPVVGNSFNQKIEAELEKIEKLESENLRLTNENDMLKRQLADYISRIEKIEKDKSSPNHELSELQETNDKYLMKISELTFENAKLTASIQNMSKQTSAPVCHQKPAGYGNVYRNSNGYTSWN